MARLMNPSGRERFLKKKARLNKLGINTVLCLFSAVLFGGIIAGIALVIHYRRILILKDLIYLICVVVLIGFSCLVYSLIYYGNTRDGG